MIVPAFGSNKFVEANKILHPNRSRNNFRRTKLIFIIFFVFFLFFSKMKMRNEIAGKRIGNGNKREEKERNCWCRLKKSPQCRGAGKISGRGRGGEKTGD